MQGPVSPRLITSLRRLFGSAIFACAMMVGGTILLGLLLASSTVRAADLPARNLTNGARSVRVNGFHLWYREIGGAERETGPGSDRSRPVSREPKEVLVAVHGGPGMSDHYFGGVLDVLADRYRVVYYDQRGSGYSQIRPEAGFYRFQYLVDDLETLRRRVIRSDRIVVLGHSYGGLVAMKYAIDHPEHVAGLILVSSMPPRDYRKIDPGESRFDAALLRERPEVADQMLLSSYRYQVLDGLYDPARTPVPDIGYMSYVPGRLLWDSSIGYDYTESLRKLDTPALIVYGARDTFVAVVPKMLHAALRNSTTVEFPTSGHWAFLEEPVRFVTVVRRFLDRLPDN